jgi:16S rRNA (guanine527-N7)-methyltransferase
MEKLKSGARKLGIELTPEQLDKFEMFYRELISWNKHINLTRITDYEEVQLKHFLDSLTVLTASDLTNNLRVIDVGSGLGMPGIPLKIVSPGIKLTLLEATGKKVKFLEHLTGKLGLDGVEIVIGRAEEIGRDARYREKFDLALSRAVAPLPVTVELTLPFCEVGGLCVALKKGDIEAEIQQSLKVIDVMGGRLREVKLVALEGLDDKRCLVIIDKLKSTPLQYPRRSGIPAKRPILS